MIRSCFCIAVAAGLSAAMFIAVEWRDADEQRTVTSRPHEATSRTFSSMMSAIDAPTQPERTDDDDAPAALAASIATKYAALLATLPSITQAQLIKILVAKERIEPASLSAISDSEREISVLLSESDYALYEQLRESDRERSRVQAFAKQVREIYPLTPQQQHELLFAMLKHQRESQALDLQLEADRADLPPMEASYVRDVAAQGVRHYTRAFLDDARSLLTDQQWLALERFEMSATSASPDDADDAS